MMYVSYVMRCLLVKFVFRQNMSKYVLLFRQMYIHLHYSIAKVLYTTWSNY